MFRVLLLSLIILLLAACSSPSTYQQSVTLEVDPTAVALETQRLVTPVDEVEAYVAKVEATSPTQSKITVFLVNNSGIFSHVAYDFVNPYFQSALTPAQGNYRFMYIPSLTNEALKGNNALDYQERTKDVYFYVNHFGRPYKVDINLYATARRTVFPSW